MCTYMYIFSTYNMANLFLANHLEKNCIIIPDGCLILPWNLFQNLQTFYRWYTILAKIYVID